MRALLISTIIYLSVPSVSLAAVIINEVAWMGSTSSANHEWVELYNTGAEAVDVTGWTLRDGMNLTINLTGNIPPLSYVVLERNRSDGVSVVSTPFLHYAGALVNTGATLTLRDTGEQIIDQVAGGENWENIGGDNVTKETAQYTTAGWVTDVSTPGLVNRTGRVDTPVPTTPATTSSQTSGARRSSGTKVETVRLSEPNTVLKLVPDIQTIAYVNQTIPLRVTPSGIAKTMIDSLHYTWNFGDGTSATGSQATTYAYRYPGTYVVTLHARYARHDQVVRHEITILPVTFSLTRSADGAIQLHNDAPYDVDLSGYLLQGVEGLVFPPHSLMVPRATITVASERLAAQPYTLVALYDTRRQLVASLVGGGVAAARANLAAASVTLPTPPRPSASPRPLISDNFSFLSTAEAAATAPVEPIALVSDTQVTERPLPLSVLADTDPDPLPVAPSPPKRFPWSYMVFVLILAAATVSIFINRGKSTEAV